MTLDELATRLSREDPRPARSGPTAMLAGAALLAFVAVVALALLWLRPRADLGPELVSGNYVFVLKLIFTVSVAASALPIVRDLATPGRRLGRTSALAALPFAVVAVLALHEIVGLPPSQWPGHVGHARWFDCLWQIPALALPAFAILALAVRTLAPTQLIRTGAFLGLAAGGLGAIGYALHCHDDAVAFVALSYTLAIAEVVILGAVAGRYVLRWR
jgi:hypothetical protein